MTDIEALLFWTVMALAGAITGALIGKYLSYKETK